MNAFFQIKDPIEDSTHKEYFTILNRIIYDPNVIAETKFYAYVNILDHVHAIKERIVKRLIETISDETCFVEEGKYDKKTVAALRKTLGELNNKTYYNVITTSEYIDQMILVFDLFDQYYFSREIPLLETKEVIQSLVNMITVLINIKEGYAFSGDEEKLVIIYGLCAVIAYNRETLENKTLDNRLADSVKTLVNLLNERFNIIDHNETLTAIALYHVTHKTDDLYRYMNYVDSLFDHKSPKKLMRFLHDFYGERVSVDIGVVDTYAINVSTSTELFDKQKIVKVIKEIKKYYHAKRSPKEIVLRISKDWKDTDTDKEAEIRVIEFLEDSMTCKEKYIRKNGDVSLGELKLTGNGR